MDIAAMKLLVRRDLHDEDSGDYRWTDAEIERHIGHAVRDFSRSIPRELTIDIPTTAGSREINIASLTDRIGIEAIEFPVGNYPARYCRFNLRDEVVTILEPEVPDGSDARIYYGALYVLDAIGSTLPASCEDIVSEGACGYAAVEWAIYAVNRVNVGGTSTSTEILEWGRSRLSNFRKALRKMSRSNTVRVSSLYRPAYPSVSQSVDYGPR